jgi:hypothetical protein
MSPKRPFPYKFTHSRFASISHLHMLCVPPRQVINIAIFIFLFQVKNLMYVPKEGTGQEENVVKPPQKPLEEVTCFKCGCKGHYANKCPKGHLAFLSQSQNPLPPGNFRRS